MTSSFTITAPGGTDIWRKPPTTDIFNAPRSSHTHNKPTGLLSSFHSARVSFLFRPTEQYDQAGLILSLHTTTTKGSGSTATPDSSSSIAPPKWIKTGVEYYNGVPKAATVACDAWADWSLSPVSGSGATDVGNVWVTVLVENGKDELGRSLWIYQVGDDGEKIPLREVCWPFGHEGADQWEIGVEAYACRPAKEAKDTLVAEFKDFDIKWV